MMVEQLQEIGFRKAASGGHYLIGGGKNPTVIQVQEAIPSVPPCSDLLWSVHADGKSFHIPAPGDIPGVYKVLEVFGIPFSRLKTTEQKLVANKWLPVDSGVFRTVDLDHGWGGRLYYALGTGNLYAGKEWLTSVLLRASVTPEEAQKIFLCISGR